ncbi:LysR family transcriptional regulator [Massilia niastensis]|uniref:LysR family transcriptional regulator n=1 Tax=Massilia niastensis TaxID=544911 RepID=UPI00036DCC8A|nr:LysR family transcriptional regulator [Massilia niastensis]
MTTFHNMDLNLLRVFQAVSEERSLTLAGNRLHLSQPAVSHAVNRLRELFGDPLFVRTRDGMQPTPTALELEKPIGRALQAVQDALRLAGGFDPAVSERVFRVSMTDVAEMVFLPPICEQLRVLAPNVQLKVVQVPQDQIVDSLRTGHLDFAIGNLPALKETTRHALLFSESYCCLTRKRVGLPRHKALSLEEYQALSHVQVRSAESSHSQLALALQELGVGRRVALEIPHFSVLPLILLQSDLAATLPLRIAKLFNIGEQFRIYGLPVSLPAVDVTLHWHEEFENDQGSRWLRQLVLDLLQRYGRNS